jgi:hypothetical protein
MIMTTGRLVTVGVFLFAVALVLAILLSAATALADKRYQPTCGQNTGSWALAGNLTRTAASEPDGWTITWQQKCGQGGTVEVELQRTTDGGAHWNDVVRDGVVADALYTTSSGDAGKVVTNRTIYFTNCTSSLSDAERLRGRVWDATGGTSTQTSYFCPHN